MAKSRPSGLKYKKHKENPTSFKKGIVPWNKGKKGVMPKVWNKGLTGKEYAKHYKNGFKGKVMRGKDHPMYGKKMPEERKKRISEVKKRQYIEHPEIWDGVRATKGIKRSKEFCEAVSKRVKGKKHPMWNGGTIVINCHYCNREVKRHPSYLKNKKNNFCSRKCEALWRSENIRRENHPNWLGGKSFEPYTDEFDNNFRKKIRERDNQICMLCNIHREKLDRELSVHHVDYNKLLTIPQNCISICLSCHMKTNFNRKHWTKFFQSLLAERYDYNYSELNEPILEIL